MNFTRFGIVDTVSNVSVDKKTFTRKVELEHNPIMAHYTLPSRTTIIMTKDMRVAAPRTFDLPLSSITVIGNPTPDATIFHFTISLPVSAEEGPASICLNIVPSYTDMRYPMRGVLMLDYQGLGGLDASGTIQFNVPITKPGATVATVLELLLNERCLDLYTFNDDGNGCRHWCATILETLGEQSFVDSDVGQSFRDFEQGEAVKWGGKFPMPRIRGTFYN